jgi:hypothetical protein
MILLFFESFTTYSVLLQSFALLYSLTHTLTDTNLLPTIYIGSPPLLCPRSSMHSLAAKHIAPNQTVNDVTLSRSTDPVEVTKGVHQFYQSGAAIPGLPPITTWL